MALRVTKKKLIALGIRPNCCLRYFTRLFPGGCELTKENIKRVLLETRPHSHTIITGFVEGVCNATGQFLYWKWEWPNRPEEFAAITYGFITRHMKVSARKILEAR